MSVCLVAQWCPILCNPMGCSPPGTSVHGISQARILEQAAISYSMGPSQLGSKLSILHLLHWQADSFTTSATWECGCVYICIRTYIHTQHTHTYTRTNRKSIYGLPGGASGKEPTCQCRRHKRCRFDPWVGKIPWRKAWQPTPVFLPGESHGQRNRESHGRLQPIRSQRIGHS